MRIIALLFFLLPSIVFGLETSLKGFIALDAINYEKIQNKKGAAVIGIGVLDLKVFAEQDDITAAIKLNIDGDLAVKNTIFEEAYASYRGIRDWKFSLGKGVVKFQNLHWGAVENSYLDGGSVLGTENSWRKVSNKAFMSVSYGHRSRGFLDTLSLYGDSTEIQTDEQGNPYFVSSGTGSNPSPKYISAYSTQNVTAFNTAKQIGLANKLEIYNIANWTFTAGQIYYKNDVQPDASYGFDFGANRDGDDYEIWIDLLYGFTSKGAFEAYTTRAKDEFFLQAGSAYHYNENWTFVLNSELMIVKDQAHTYSETPFNVGSVYYKADSKFMDKSGQLVESNNFKIETAAQRKLSKSSFVTIGALFERKNATKNGIEHLSYIPGVYNANCEAFKLSSSVSFWF